MTLTPYSPAYRFNWQLPYEYDASATMPITAAWLSSAADNDVRLIDIIRSFFRLALVGGDFQKFLELVGAGGTGKSTLVRLLIALIGRK